MNTNNMKRMLMSVMLVSSMTLSSGAIVAQAYNGTPAIAERTMTNEQLVAATTPILQSYTKDASDKTWVTLDGYLDHTIHLIFKECVCFFDPV